MNGQDLMDARASERVPSTPSPTRKKKTRQKVIRDKITPRTCPHHFIHPYCLAHKSSPNSIPSGNLLCNHESKQAICVQTIAQQNLQSKPFLDKQRRSNFSQADFNEEKETKETREEVVWDFGWGIKLCRQEGSSDW